MTQLNLIYPFNLTVPSQHRNYILYYIYNSFLLHIIVALFMLYSQYFFSAVIVVKMEQKTSLISGKEFKVIYYYSYNSPIFKPVNGRSISTNFHTKKSYVACHQKKNGLLSSMKMTKLRICIKNV